MSSYNQYNPTVEADEVEEAPNEDRLLQVRNWESENYVNSWIISFQSSEVLFIILLRIFNFVTVCKQKLRKGEAENLAGRYFASNRAKEIVIRVNNDVHRAKR